jgi:hypothetical protein
VRRLVIDKIIYSFATIYSFFDPQFLLRRFYNYCNTLSKWVTLSLDSLSLNASLQRETVEYFIQLMSELRKLENLHSLSCILSGETFTLSQIFFDCSFSLSKMSFFKLTQPLSSLYHHFLSFYEEFLIF